MRNLRAQAQYLSQQPGLKRETRAYYALLHDYLLGSVKDAPERHYQGDVRALWA